MSILSKSSLLASLQCPRRLWFQTFRPDRASGSASNTRLQIGKEVGNIARAMHPGGILIETLDLKQALDETSRLLHDHSHPIFEAAFLSEGVQIRTDLLLPEDGHWRLTEVKSSASVKDHHLTDVAIQCWVIQQAQVGLAGIDIAHIDTSFVYPGNSDYQGLLKHQDVTAGIAPLLSEVPYWVSDAQTTLANPDPETPMGAQCHSPHDCPFLDYCSLESGVDEGYPPEVLPNSTRLAKELRSEGYSDIRQIPDGRLTNPLHVRIWQATCTGRALLDSEAGRIIDGLDWPRYYLDFEAIQFAIPIWRGTHPFDQIPFQWSCHIETDDGCIIHLEFLADSSDDPRRLFTESLLSAVGTTGTIIVYNAGFERSRMREVANIYPDLAPAIAAAIDRIVDLLPIARTHYYHPAMLGSWSIKAVLPTIAPDLAYDDLAVSHGVMAQDAFIELIQPDTVPNRKAFLREGLLKYCERDTLAMVRVAHYFQDTSKALPNNGSCR